MGLDPSAPSEDDTEYDGFLSYSTEWHALSVGSGAGIVGGIIFSSGNTALSMIPLSIVFMLAVGMKLEEYKPTKDVDINSKVKREVSKEPWYAIGGMVIFFSVVVAISTISGGEVPLI